MTRMVRILCLALLTIGLVGPSLPARADDRDERHEKCEKRIDRAEDKLRDAVNRHGEYSRQARKRRGRARAPVAPSRTPTRSISIVMILRAYFSAGADVSPRL